jgi:hypothetical protein
LVSSSRECPVTCSSSSRHSCRWGKLHAEHPKHLLGRNSWLL